MLQKNKHSLVATLRSFIPSFEVSAGCVLRYRSHRGSRYLLLRYPHGHWDFVKGHIESGESEQEALVREVYEETGIPSSAVRIFPNFRRTVAFSYRAKGTEYEKRIRNGRGIFVFKRVIFFLVDTTQSTVACSEEHIGSAWLPYSEAMETLTFNGAKAVLAAAHSFAQEAEKKKEGRGGIREE